jgi:hypothetical protein
LCSLSGDGIGITVKYGDEEKEEEEQEEEQEGAAARGARFWSSKVDSQFKENRREVR